MQSTRWQWSPSSTRDAVHGFDTKPCSLGKYVPLLHPVMYGDHFGYHRCCLPLWDQCMRQLTRTRDECKPVVDEAIPELEESLKAVFERTGYMRFFPDLIISLWVRKVPEENMDFRAMVMAFMEYSMVSEIRFIVTNMGLSGIQPICDPTTMMPPELAVSKIIDELIPQCHKHTDGPLMRFRVPKLVLSVSRAPLRSLNCAAWNTILGHPDGMRIFGSRSMRGLVLELRLCCNHDSAPGDDLQLPCTPYEDYEPGDGGDPQKAGPEYDMSDSIAAYDTYWDVLRYGMSPCTAVTLYDLFLKHLEFVHVTSLFWHEEFHSRAVAEMEELLDFHYVHPGSKESCAPAADDDAECLAFRVHTDLARLLCDVCTSGKHGHVEYDKDVRTMAVPGMQCPVIYLMHAQSAPAAAAIPTLVSVGFQACRTICQYIGDVVRWHVPLEWAALPGFYQGARCIVKPLGDPTMHTYVKMMGTTRITTAVLDIYAEAFVTLCAQHLMCGLDDNVCTLAEPWTWAAMEKFKDPECELLELSYDATCSDIIAHIHESVTHFPARDGVIVNRGYGDSLHTALFIRYRMAARARVLADKTARVIWFPVQRALVENGKFTHEHIHLVAAELARALEYCLPSAPGGDILDPDRLYYMWALIVYVATAFAGMS